MPKTVLVFGTFDIFHPGHNFFLKAAKKHGDRLIVVVARDRTVKELKGQKPFYDENARLEKLKSLPCVEMAVLGNLGDKLEIVGKIRPEVVVLGYDQFAFTKDLGGNLKKRGLKTKVVRINESLEPEIYKSSKLRQGLEKGQTKG